MDADPDSEQTLLRRPAAPAQVLPAVHALLLRQDGVQPRRVPLTETPLRIGRGPQNELVLPSPEISRQHCTVVVSGAAAILTDLASTNGVHVDGARVEGTAVLSPGERLAIGPFTLVYQRGSAAELAEAEAREHEQARAVGYIRALLPPPLRDGAVHAEWCFVPSAQLGGDAFGYRWLDNRRFAAFLLDVSGHGVGSALLAASAANMLRARGLGGMDLADPAAVLGSLNAAFQMDDHDGLFFSLWYGVYDQSSRTLRYASAGHHPAYLAAGAPPQPLATRALAIGMAPMATFHAAETTVPAGATLYLFSDGVFEVSMLDGRTGTVRDLLALMAEGPSEQTEPDRLYHGMRELTGRRPFEDDFSLVTLNFP